MTYSLLSLLFIQVVVISLLGRWVLKLLSQIERYTNATWNQKNEESRNPINTHPITIFNSALKK